MLAYETRRGSSVDPIPIETVYTTVSQCVRRPGLDEYAAREPAWADALRARVSSASREAWASAGPLEDVV